MELGRAFVDKIRFFRNLPFVKWLVLAVDSIVELTVFTVSTELVRTASLCPIYLPLTLSPHSASLCCQENWSKNLIHHRNH